MYIRRDCLNAIGALDEELFPRGYGEETDFCFRANRKGFAHVIDDRTLVLHARSKSFGDEALPLKKRSFALLRDKYPEFAPDIAAMAENGSILEMRWRIRRGIQLHSQGLLKPRRRIMFVISTTTGGTPQTNFDLMMSVCREYEPYCLRVKGKLLYLTQIVSSHERLIGEWQLEEPISISTHHSSEYDQVVNQLLIENSIDLVHIRHIAWHSFGLGSVCQQLQIPIVFSFHDFYVLGPSLKLLDDENKYCAGRCTTSGGKCKAELWENDKVPELKHRFVYRWRELSSDFLSRIDAFVTTSPYAKSLLEATNPYLMSKRFEVIPHGRDFTAFRRSGETIVSEDERLRILAPGNISVAKGARLIEEIIELDRGRQFEFHTLGDPGRLAHLVDVLHHGTYDRASFNDIVAQIKPHIGIVLSIWPETYSHTLTELWASGVPALGLDIGAVGERLRESEAGWLLNSQATASDVYQFLLALKRDPGQIQRAIQRTVEWQIDKGSVMSVSDMAAKYLRLYERVLDERRVFRLS